MESFSNQYNFIGLLETQAPEKIFYGPECLNWFSIDGKPS